MLKVLTNRHISDRYDTFNNGEGGYFNENTEEWNDASWGRIDGDRRLNKHGYSINSRVTHLNKDDYVFESLAAFFARNKI